MAKLTNAVFEFLCVLYILYSNKLYLTFVFLWEQLWVGGTSNQTRLAQIFMDKVKIQELEKVFEPMFHFWKNERSHEDESFGDFAMRVVCFTYLKPAIALPFLSFRPYRESALVKDLVMFE